MQSGAITTFLPRLILVLSVVFKSPDVAANSSQSCLASNRPIFECWQNLQPLKPHKCYALRDIDAQDRHNANAREQTDDLQNQMFVSISALPFTLQGRLYIRRCHGLRSIPRKQNC